MTINNRHSESHSPSPDGPEHPRPVDPDQVRPELVRMIDRRLDAVASVEAIVEAFDGPPERLQAMTAVFPVAEGHLLEAGFRQIVERSGGYRVLTNIKLPILKAAEDIVARNDPAGLRGISFDADVAGKRSYTPDAILIDRASRNAILVEIKRDLSSYDLTALRDRMLAAGLIARDYLYKHCKGVQVDAVGSVIVSANGARTDTENGVCSIADLDALLGTEGVSTAMAMIPHLFAERKTARWDAARQRYHQTILGRHASAGQQTRTDGAVALHPSCSTAVADEAGEADETAAPAVAIPAAGGSTRVGFLVVPRRAAG